MHGSAAQHGPLSVPWTPEGHNANERRGACSGVRSSDVPRTLKGRFVDRACELVKWRHAAAFVCGTCFVERAQVSDAGTVLSAGNGRAGAGTVRRPKQQNDARDKALPGRRRPGRGRRAGRPGHRGRRVPLAPAVSRLPPYARRANRAVRGPAPSHPPLALAERGGRCGSPASGRDGIMAPVTSTAHCCYS